MLGDSAGHWQRFVMNGDGIVAGRDQSLSGNPTAARGIYSFLRVKLLRTTRSSSLFRSFLTKPATHRIRSTQ